VVTKVARFKRALPSSMSSSWMISYAISAAIGWSVAKGDAVSEHAGEGVSDGEAHADGYNHASEEVGREPKGLVGGDEDDGRHDLRPRVHSDGEGNYGQAHSSVAFGPPLLTQQIVLASSGKACTLSRSRPRQFMRARIP
jgi:hypothetical protein